MRRSLKHDSINFKHATRNMLAQENAQQVNAFSPNHVLWIGITVSEILMFEQEKTK